MSNSKPVNLYGRLFITGDIEAVTGLHIGGAPAALAIGSVDNPVIRDAMTNRPYIPGSSLRGKMRSLWEKITGVDQNWPIGKGVKIHICEQQGDYGQCPVCQIYGIPGQLESSSPTRLIVRDVLLDNDNARKLLKEAQTDQPYTEVKWEAAIDRVTSAATPRQIERVPAGTVFTGFEMVFSIYEAGDLDRFTHILEAMQLLEDDYLGGAGSRGGGKIQFQNLTLKARSTRTGDGYSAEHPWRGEASSVADLLQQKQAVQDWAKQAIPLQPFGR